MISSPNPLRPPQLSPAEAGTSGQVVSRTACGPAAETPRWRDDRRGQIAAGIEPLAGGIGGRFDSIAVPPRMVRLAAGSVCCGHCGQTIDESEQVCPDCGRRLG